VVHKKRAAAAVAAAAVAVACGDQPCVVHGKRAVAVAVAAVCGGQPCVVHGKRVAVAVFVAVVACGWKGLFDSAMELALVRRSCAKPETAAGPPFLRSRCWRAGLGEGDGLPTCGGCRGTEQLERSLL